jgi:hypothetical protein
MKYIKQDDGSVQVHYDKDGIYFMISYSADDKTMFQFSFHISYSSCAYFKVFFLI